MPMTAIDNPYLPFVLSQMPRILSQIDRDADSGTFGCCDRTFWHYKMRDFPSAILQQPGWGLALLYTFSHPLNSYYQKEEIKNLALATLDFWRKIQRRNGSFDEYWPHEQSYPATVFSLHAAVEVARLLHVKNTALTTAIRKAADFVQKNRENGALNQEIAGACALFNAGKYLQDALLLAAARRKMAQVIAKQNEEGWFPEYGGADLGYLTVSLNYLSEYYLLSHDERAKEALRKIISFLCYFIHPDGSFGGDYGSRNTEYFLPAGFEIARDIEPLSGKIVQHLLPYACSAYPLDDRYLLHYLFSSFVRAAVLSEQRKEKKAEAPEKKIDLFPYQEVTEKHFPQAGLFVKSMPSYFAVTALSKGGVFVLFDKKQKKRVLNDCGYRFHQGVHKDISTNRKMFVTNWLNKEYSCEKKVTSLGTELTVETSFYAAQFHALTTLQFFLLRPASLLLGKKLIPLLKRRFIHPHQKIPVQLRRRIFFTEKEVEVRDGVFPQKKFLLWSRFQRAPLLVKASNGLSLRFCPSSKFFQKSTLDVQPSQKEQLRFPLNRKISFA